MRNVSTYLCWAQRSATGSLTGLLSLAVLLLTVLPAEASTPLTRADIEALRNQVEFLPRGRSARPARMSDVLSVGDALRTALSSRADLRFNDGSLARVGEQATFRFVPNTRNFRLNNGTVLLLIPPGQGRTNIQTPSAVTGIQGSAVVVRYIPDRDLTLVMALTNNPTGPMTVTAGACEDGVCNNQVEYPLYAGQIALIQQNQVQVMAFDLHTFYQTSPMVDGLELNNPEAEAPLGSVLETVRQETLEALEEQPEFSEGTPLTPDMIGVGLIDQAEGSPTWDMAPQETLEALEEQPEFSEGTPLTPDMIGVGLTDQAEGSSTWDLAPSAGVTPLPPISGVITPVGTPGNVTAPPFSLVNNRPADNPARNMNPPGPPVATPSPAGPPATPPGPPATLPSSRPATPPGPPVISPAPVSPPTGVGRSVTPPGPPVISPAPVASPTPVTSSALPEPLPIPVTPSGMQIAPPAPATPPSVPETLPTPPMPAESSGIAPGPDVSAPPPVLPQPDLLPN
jgi:hypothetical protein